MVRTTTLAVATFLAGCVLATFIVAAALGDSGPTPTPSPVATVSSTPAPAGLDNVAFDQIDRIIAGTGTPPPVNGFDADVAAIQAAQSASFMPSTSSMTQSLVSSLGSAALGMIPFVGGFLAGAAARAQANAQRKKYEDQLNAWTGPNPGVLNHYAFYNGWMRIEVPNLVLIVKPEQHLKIYLNPVKKTYRIEDAANTLTPPPDDSTPDADATPSTQSTPAPPPQADVTIAYSQTDATSIAAQPVVGYAADATVRLTNGTDPCHDGTFTAKQVVYVDQSAEPLDQATADEQTFYALALPDGCDVALHPQITGAVPPPGRMYIYRLVTVIHDPTALSTPSAPTSGMPNAAAMQRAIFGSNEGPGPNYMVLSERSNIRELGEADAALFEVPADYAETK